MPRAATASDADASLVLATNSKTDNPRSSVPEGASPRFDTEVSHIPFIPLSGTPTPTVVSYQRLFFRATPLVPRTHITGAGERGHRRARFTRTLWRERGTMSRLYFSASPRFVAVLHACSVFEVVAWLCRWSEFLKACSSRFHVRVFSASSASSGHLAWLYQ